jgi:hypothetical protein
VLILSCNLPEHLKVMTFREQNFLCVYKTQDNIAVPSINDKAPNNL